MTQASDFITAIDRHCARMQALRERHLGGMSVSPVGDTDDDAAERHDLMMDEAAAQVGELIADLEALRDYVSVAGDWRSIKENVWGAVADIVQQERVSVVDVEEEGRRILDMYRRNEAMRMRNIASINEALKEQKS